MAAAPTVFISYSWHDESTKEWVHELGTRLASDGANVWLDQWLLRPGVPLPGFMESAIRESDFVLIVCTPDYKAASDSRSGGVGYEGDILTGEILTGQESSKFIPVLRMGTWSESAPSWALGRWYIDLRGSPHSEENYSTLLRTLFGRFSGSAQIAEKTSPVSRLGLSKPRRGHYVGNYGTPRRIVAHFLDHYVLELSGYGRGNGWIDRAIAKEAWIALRIALLAADEVLIPAVSYFQSPLCRRLVNKHRAIFDLGVIRLIGDAHRWDEFRENRLREYSSESLQYDIYSNLNSYRGRLPPLIGSDHNTTLALHSEWNNLVVPRSFELLSPAPIAGDRVRFVADPERLADRIPELMGNEAFVAENLYPRLFDSPNPNVLGNLSGLICSLFFRVHTGHFAAGYVDDLVYIRRVIPDNAGFTISYRSILRRLRFVEDLYVEVCTCRPLDLLGLQRDQRVAIIVRPSSAAFDA